MALYKSPKAGIRGWGKPHIYKKNGMWYVVRKYAGERAFHVYSRKGVAAAWAKLPECHK